MSSANAERLLTHWNYELVPLTPVHIGTGETIEATEYAVRDSVFVRFDPASVVAELDETDLRLLETLMGRGDAPLHLRSFFAQRATHGLYECEVDQGVAEELERVAGNPQNALLVAECVRSGGAPIIPGSSLKGALRTGVLHGLLPVAADGRAGGRRMAAESESAQRNYEAAQLGYLTENRQGGTQPDIPRDPMKLLKVSDARGAEAKSVVYRVRHFNMGSSDDFDSVADMREGTPSFLTHGADYVRYDGTLTWLTAEGVHARLPQAAVTEPGRVLAATDALYRGVLAEERAYWEGHGRDEVVDAVALVELWADRLAEGTREHGPGALVRLGWGSGRDGVSLDIAKDRGSHGRGRINDHYRYSPRTRRIAGDKYPMGWCFLSLSKEVSV